MAELKQKILIVDDTPLNIKMLGEVLRDDYKVMVATSGERALQIARSDTAPDIILLDIMMPVMDGYEVCKQLKTDGRTQGIPVIFISAKCETADEMRGLELGAVDYISKPFSMPIVNARIKTHLALKKKSDMLEWLTCTDGLTNIANRRRLNEFLKQEWNRGRRIGSLLSLIFVDIDFFKKYNDHYGHQSGDDCLVNVANILESSLARSTDFVARYGGEEFVAILPETGSEASLGIAEKIRRNVEQADIPHVASDLDRHVTLSLGVASMIPVDGVTADDLLKAADAALYAAKENGRNRVVEFTGSIGVA